MVDYWIPGARLIFGAVIAVCALIAVIVINVQDAGRGRTFGLLGAVLLFASTLLGAVNRSVGSVYGTDTLTFDVGLVLVGGCAAAGLVLLAFAVVRLGPPRRRGSDL